MRWTMRTSGDVQSHPQRRVQRSPGQADLDPAGAHVAIVLQRPEQLASAEPQFATVAGAQPAVKCGHVRLEGDIHDLPERLRSEHRDHARAHAIYSFRPRGHGSSLAPWEPCLVPHTFKVRRKAPVTASDERPIFGLPRWLRRGQPQAAEISRLSPGQDDRSHHGRSACPNGRRLSRVRVPLIQGPG